MSVTKPGPEPSVTSLEALLAGTAVQAKHLAGISEELLRQLKLSKVARAYFATMATLTLLVCSALVWIALGNRAINHTVQDNTNRIIDCTTSSGRCYQQGQKATATAVTAIVNAQLAAAWCSKHSASFSSAQKCVIRLTKPS